MKYVVTKRCNCEDWKTASVRPKPELTPGMVVEGEPMNNFYGSFLSVRTEDGTHYYIKPECATAKEAHQ